MYRKDTIAAIATPAGKGGIGVVRVSGQGAAAIAQKITGQNLEPRKATYCDFLDLKGELVDQGIALFFVGPASFTGEDVLELQGHGGPVIVSMLLQTVIDAGARMARAGEFSERAFLNNKLDLAQAEAVADLIDSVTVAAAKGAIRSLKGEFSERIHQLDQTVVNLRMYTEAAIDFPEEEIDFLSDDHLAKNTADAQRMLDSLLQQSKKGAMLREGITLVIAGEPNAGKSSLMNRFVGDDVSIVTDIPGTTRDVIKEHISLDGIPAKLVDTAGLRQTQDQIEQEGVRRAREEMLEADGILVIVDASKSSSWKTNVESVLADLPSSSQVLVVLNKTDLVDSRVNTQLDYPYPVVSISAKTGDGFSTLIRVMKEVFLPGIATESPFISRARHVDALVKANEHLQTGIYQLKEAAAGELFAEELRLCHEALTEITGEFSSDDLLGEIFSSFCIGK